MDKLPWTRPDCYIRHLQRTGMAANPVNSFEAEYNERDLGNGIRLLSNVCYGHTYPNSFLDIYQNTAHEKGPTFFYIHGGGYAWGDKAEGDSTAGKGDLLAATRYLQSVCTLGYQVVSINYALSPDYVYPVPIEQINQAVRLLQRKEAQYHLDMTRLVFAGGSAGGQLAGQYVNLQTNPSYASEMKMEQALKPRDILGIVFNCSLLEPKRFAKTGDADTDLMFSALEQCYFGTDSTILRQADVTANLTPDFPAAYITDGSQATFDAQAKRLDAALTAMGIPHTCNFYSEAQLGHGYDSFLDNPYAQDNLKKTLNFLLQFSFR